MNTTERSLWKLHCYVEWAASLGTTLREDTCVLQIGTFRPRNRRDMVGKSKEFNFLGLPHTNQSQRKWESEGKVP